MTEFEPFLDSFGTLLDDGLLLVDGTTTRIDYMNLSAVRFLGDNRIGVPITQVLTSPSVADEIEACYKDGSVGECISGSSTDALRQFRVRMLKIGAESLAILLMDMTLEHNVEKMRRDFIANVSHELRSPLTALVGFIETMQNSAAMDEAQRNHFLGIMATEAGRMTRLIDGLMSLSRVETGEHIAPTEPIAIDKIVADVVAHLGNRANIEGRKIIFSDTRASPDDDAIVLGDKDEIPSPHDCSVMPDAIVLGDRDEIIEVFHNLLDNALKYAYPQSDIRVELSQHNTTHFRFDVINQGEGIKPKHIGRLTERFYRIDKARTRDMGGTGLGLAIVKHIISRHRGQMEIRSEPMGATVFSVILPRAKG